MPHTRVFKIAPATSGSRETAGADRANAVGRIRDSDGIRVPLADVPSIFSRGDSKFLSKRKRQVGLARKPASDCDLRDTGLYMLKQLTGLLETPLQHVPMGRHTRRGTKHPQKMAPAMAGFCR